MPKLQLKKDGIIRQIEGRNYGAKNQLSINGDRFDLTDNIALTNGKPTLEFKKNGKVFYIREKFNKTDTITICAKTHNPRDSSRVYRVDSFLIPSRAASLSKLKIDVTVSDRRSHRNDGDRIAKGYVVLEAFSNGNRVFSKEIWRDQTNGGDGASGFEAGTIYNKNLSDIINDYSLNIYDLYISIYLSTGDYQAHVDGGKHRYQRVHGICVTTYD